VGRSSCRAQADGLTVDVGVSNFQLDQLDEIERETGVRDSGTTSASGGPLAGSTATSWTGIGSAASVLEGYSGLRGGALEHRSSPASPSASGAPQPE
jgi:hypothetical protein